MILRRLALLVLMVTLSAALSVAPAALAQGFLDIQSDKLSLDNKTSSAIFTGNVKVERDGIVMTADHVKVNYAPLDDAAESSNRSEGRSDDVEQIEATGHVRIMDGTREITAETALYDVPQDTMTLTGNVVVTEGRENTIKGTKMLYDMTQGLITMSAEAGRVKAKLVPSK